MCSRREDNDDDEENKAHFLESCAGQEESGKQNHCPAVSPQLTGDGVVVVWPDRIFLQSEANLNVTSKGVGGHSIQHDVVSDRRHEHGTR